MSEICFHVTWRSAGRHWLNDIAQGLGTEAEEWFLLIQHILCLLLYVLNITHGRKFKNIWVWWCTPSVPALRQISSNLKRAWSDSEFHASQDCMLRSCLQKMFWGLAVVAHTFTPVTQEREGGCSL